MSTIRKFRIVQKGILTHTGKVSTKEAQEKAETEFVKFKKAADSGRKKPTEGTGTPRQATFCRS